MSLCNQCIQGVTHVGNAKGSWETIGGVQTYVSTPTGNYSAEKAILFLADALGPQHINTQLLADDFAANGFKTYTPDIFDGEPLPREALDPDNEFALSKTYNLKIWLDRHDQGRTRPIIDKVVEALRAEGVSELGATGYCFGGRYVFDLAFDNIIKVAVVSHPSLLKLPEDLEKYFTLSKAPLMINSCTFDVQFPPSASEKADELFGKGRYAPGYTRTHFEGLTHGFAVRGDMSDPAAKEAKELAFTGALEWFKEKL